MTQGAVLFQKSWNAGKEITVTWSLSGSMKLANEGSVLG